jgi:hypothetical protein
MPVRRAIVMASVEFWFEAVYRTVVMTPVEFWFKPRSRAIKMPSGMIAGAAVTDAVPVKIAISGPIPFLKLFASIRMAVAASIALGPGIARQGDNESNPYNADDNDLFFHGSSPCFRGLMPAYPDCLTHMTNLISEKFTKIGAYRYGKLPVAS